MMKLFFYYFLIFFSAQAWSNSSGQALNHFSTIESITKPVALASEENCSDTADFDLKNKKVELRDNGRSKYKVSVLTKKQLKFAFDIVSFQAHIPYGYLENGGQARAHEMANILERYGIIVGKTCIFGNNGDYRVSTKKSPKGYVDWWGHVAPFVLVEVQDKLVPYVLDPSLFDQAISKKSWLSKQVDENPRVKFSYRNTSRFLYSKFFGETIQHPTSYSSKSRDDTQGWLKIGVKLLKHRNQLHIKTKVLKLVSFDKGYKVMLDGHHGVFYLRKKMKNFETTYATLLKSKEARTEVSVEADATSLEIKELIIKSD